MNLPVALRELASLIETRPSARSALSEWHRHVDDPAAARVSRRARMGAELVKCLEPLHRSPDGSLVARAICAHSRHGGSLVHTLHVIAKAIEVRDRSMHDARSATSASKLSVRLLAGIALTCLVLLPAWHRVPAALIAMSSTAALVLCAVGTVWMRKLQPRPPQTEHPVAAIADLTAALLDAGLHLPAALDLACPSELASVRRLVRLGVSWPDALGRSGDEELRRMADLLHTTSRSGVSAGEALRHLAMSLRELRRRECELAARRAPILVVLPLTLCFLPAFVLVMVVPLLRGLST